MRRPRPTLDSLAQVTAPEPASSADVSRDLSIGSLTLPRGFENLAEHGELMDVVITALDEVERELSEAVSNADQLADHTSRHLLEAGGKRIRPLLTILSALVGDPGVRTGQVGEVAAAVRSAAVVMELTHLATLYHDDVMDEAPVRRGAPAAHQVWGNSIAILAGDLIFARASLLMASLGPEAVAIQARTFERLVMGQLWETVGPTEDDDPLDHYLRVIGGKTGSLIAAAGQLGAHFGGCDAATVGLLEEYGEKVGMAFQLADDVIDLTSSSHASGKTPGTDLRERVPTLPVLLLRQVAAGDSADAASASAALELVDGPLDTDEQLSAAVAAVSAHPVIGQAWEITRGWSADAVRALAPLPDSPVKGALVAFAEYVVDRES
ncbi:polyprenyl synthetase family protein [Citricoccus nitrophenolicus]|uniref:polyprenyl synthetase family protein n=1 Tax=Citricoccus nitrophenolicus TaxID=863575 RepID=UPI0039B6DE30